MSQIDRVRILAELLAQEVAKLGAEYAEPKATHVSAKPTLGPVRASQTQAALPNIEPGNLDNSK